MIQAALAGALLAAGAASPVAGRLPAVPQVCPSGVCATPVATLATPTTTCQSTSLALTCANAATYAVTLVQGQTYTFTTCGATCPGSSASFDSRLELWRGGLMVASSSNACGSNGEIVYATNPFGGGGPYCVKVVPESGFGDFTLSWRVTCQAPSSLLLDPVTLSAFDDDCSRDVTFSVNSAGTGSFRYDWTIAPPPGGSVSNPSRVITRPENSDQFSTSVSGVGTYAVRVTVSNDCGSEVGTLDFQFADAVPPDIACSAARVPCPPAPGPSPLWTDDAEPWRGGPSAEDPASPLTTASGMEDGGAGAPATERPDGAAGETMQGSDLARRLADNRDAVAALLFGAGSEEEARELIARKLDLAASDVLVVDGSDPAYFRPPGQNALSCATPCTSGVIGADHPYYDVFLSCGQGFFSARTGASHSVTGGQNVIYGGQNSSAVTSDFSIHFHNSGLTRLAPLGGRACAFNPPDTTTEPNSVGLEQEWTLDPVVTGIPSVTARQEIVAFGSNEANSGVRLTLGVMNPATSTATINVGMRWQIDYQNAADDGPGFATVLCSPFTIGPERFREHEFTPAEILDFYRIQNNTGSPIFGNFTSTSRIVGFRDTRKPDRLIYGEWPFLRGSPWNYVAREGANADGDSATMVYYGYQPASALVIPPGQAATRSVVIFTSAQQESCGELFPGTSTGTTINVCQNDCVRLRAVASDNCSMASVLLSGSSAGAPACTGNPCIVSFPATGSYTYTWQATDTSGNSTSCDTRVNVSPAPQAVLARIDPVCGTQSITLDARGSASNGCSVPLEYQYRDATSILSPWGPSPTYGPFVPASGTYHAEVRCSTATSLCRISRASRTVSATSFPIPVIQPVAPVCAGGTAILDVSASGLAGCSTALEFRWSDAGGVLRTWDPSWTFFVSPAVTTTYTVEARCPSGPTCVATGSTTIVVLPSPAASVADPGPVCAGSPVTLDASGTSANGCTALEFQWSDAGGVVQPWGPGPTYGPFVPPGTGTWTVEVRCATAPACASSAARTVTVTAFPVATVQQPAAVCAGGTVTIDASSSSGAGCGVPLEFQFSDGTGVLQPWSTTASYPVTPGATTTYTVDVRCPANVTCVASAATAAAIVPIPTAAVTGPVAVCAGTPVTLDASSSSGNGCPVPLEYQLRNGAGVLVPWGSSPAFGPLTPSSSTTYTVDVRCPAAQPACSSSGTHAVAVVPIPTAIAGPDASVCQNASLTLSGSGSSAPGCAGGALYEWRQGATVVRPASPVATYNPPTGTLGTTVYTLVVSCGSLTSCQALDDVAVQIRNCTMAVRFDTYAAAWLGDGSGVEVTWRTLEELDTSFFVVERSASVSGPWSGVGDPVSAVGPGYPYRFVDATASAGTRPWYRIVEYTSSGRGDQTPAFETR